MNAVSLPDPQFDPDVPGGLKPWDEPEGDTDLDFVEMPCTDGDCPTDDEYDERWEAFIPDEDEWDPQPEPGDFRSQLVAVVFALAA